MNLTGYLFSDVSGNPMFCNCSLAEFAVWAKDIIHANGISCNGLKTALNKINLTNCRKFIIVIFSATVLIVVIFTDLINNFDFIVVDVVVFVVVVAVLLLLLLLLSFPISLLKSSYFSY